MPPIARLRRPVRPTIETVHIPAPIGGLNTISAGSAMPLSDCMQLWNMSAAEYGLRSRLGSREWCIGLTGAVDNQVRTVLPFTGSTKNGTQNRLFACTSTGIWDVSASSSGPSQVLTFSTQTGDAGWGVSHVVVTSAGHFLLYCDEENGLFIYTEGSGTWAAVTMGGGATQISGVNPANLVFVNAFKNRVWFVEKDTARAWYLAAGAIYGAATAFEFGTKFRAGGPLVGLWNWTVDGGLGLDDSLVAISKGGDVGVWQGTDPASATTFGLRGVWYIGDVPEGRRIATNYGGDVLLLTRLGIVPLSRLLSGDEERSQYATAKIANLFNSLMLSKAGLKGWSMRLHPEDNALLVTVPTTDGYPTEQLAMSRSGGRPWSRYRDLPMYSTEVWGGKFYFGTTDGRICINDGYVDGITLTDPNSYTPVQWALLTAFSNLGNDFPKQVQMIRPTILCDGAIADFRAEARYKYDFTELATVSPTPGGGDSWDSGLWDTALWGGEYTATQEVVGAAGMGIDVAITIRGPAVTRTVLTGINVRFIQGRGL